MASITITHSMFAALSDAARAELFKMLAVAPSSSPAADAPAPAEPIAAAVAVAPAPAPVEETVLVVAPAEAPTPLKKRGPKKLADMTSEERAAHKAKVVERKVKKDAFALQVLFGLRDEHPSLTGS